MPATMLSAAPLELQPLPPPANPVPTNPFAGPYVGFKVGGNWSDGRGAQPSPEHFTVFPGLVAGYGFDLGSVILGAELFADFHHGSSTFKDAGIDAKLGVPFDNVMPYARIGITGTWPDVRPHGGVGVEFMLAPRVSLAAEWTMDRTNAGGTRRTNNSVTLGLNYRFY